MKNVIKLLLICFLFQGCAYVIGSKINSHFTSQTPNAKILVAPAHVESWNDQTLDSNKDSIGVGSGKSKMRSANPAYLVQQELVGYKTDRSIIFPTKYNIGKVVGYSSALVSDLVILGLISTSNSENSSDYYVPAFFWWASTWWIFSAGPKYVYEKSYKLKPLIPLPKKNKEEKNLVIDKVSIMIDATKTKYEYYDRYSNYKKDEPSSRKFYNDKIEYENTNFTDDLNKLLVKYQYADTTKRMLANAFNSLHVRINITDSKTVEIAGVNYLSLIANWGLYDQFDKSEKLSKNIHMQSRWIANQGVSEEQSHGLMVDALDNGLIEFLNDSSVQKFLKTETIHYAGIISKWKTLKIIAGETASSVSDVAKSVVTIKTKEGHGSGCLISKDGLIITNYHVAGDSSSKLQLLFEDGSKDSGIVIRASPEYDLALIKSNSHNLKSLKINLSKNIDIGNEVFAIGTPEDIDLGQTVTKGIISGKRKVDEKIYIQTDVSISPGNSGGALITKDGVVVGIINAKVIGKGVEGIGFAIPSYYIENAMKIKFEE